MTIQNPTNSLLTHLECPKTGETFDADAPQNLSRVGTPLLARYDLSRATIKPQFNDSDSPGLWRYSQLLPIRDRSNIRYLGEGWTPLLPVDELRSKLKMPNLF